MITGSPLQWGDVGSPKESGPRIGQALVDGAFEQGPVEWEVVPVTGVEQPEHGAGGATAVG